MSSRLQTGFLLAAFLALSACGGGGSGGGGAPAPLNVSTTLMPDGVVGVAYNATIGTTGGTGAKTFSISAGALPAGLALDAVTGAVTGTPNGPAGTANFTIAVTDSGTPQQNDSQAITFDVNNPLLITTVALPEATIGGPYNQQLAATGGSGTLVFTISNGATPAGIALAANGALTGPATALATNQTFTVQVADGSVPQQTDTQALIIEVLLEITTTALPDATGGVAYSQSLQARGGQPPYVGWSRTAGSMPAGIADPVAATGAVAGTPNPVCTTATSVFTAQVSDSDTPAESDSQAGIGITVNATTLAITTTSLPNGVVNTAYNTVVQATGGVPPYTFSTTGQMPSQLGPINPSTGAISGTPDTVETRNFTVNVGDTCGATDSQALGITINAVALGRNDSIATATSLTNGTFSASISPLGHPATVIDPDEDFYRLTTTASSTVTININAAVNGSPLDSVIEILAANGTRLNTCVSPAFNQPCVHDDEILGVDLDSFLEVQITGATTFYVHVVDFRGDARPDLKYDIVVSGIN